MTLRWAALAFATVVVAASSVTILRRDLRHDPRARGRAVAEALVAPIGIGVLLWWSWASL